MADNEVLKVVLRSQCPLQNGCGFPVPRGQRVRTVVPALVGAVLGGVLWVLWLGPVVLP